MIKGLDPAGPRFFDGPILSAIPELHSEILCPESAAFVDIIHSNGGLEPVAVSPVVSKAIHQPCINTYLKSIAKTRSFAAAWSP